MEFELVDSSDPIHSNTTKIKKVDQQQPLQYQQSIQQLHDQQQQVLYDDFVATTSNRSSCCHNANAGHDNNTLTKNTLDSQSLVQQQSIHHLHPVQLVEKNPFDTDVTTIEDNNGNGQCTTPTTISMSGTEQMNTTTNMVQYTMTTLLLLLISAAILSVLTVTQYKFILLCTWIILIVFFIGFCYFIYNEMIRIDRIEQQRNQRLRTILFHPIIQSMHDYVVSGIYNFIDDCQTELISIKMISNEPAYDQYYEMNSNNSNNSYNLEHPTNNNSHRSTTTATRKTRLFRTIVQPIMRLTLLKRQPKRRQKATTTTTTTTTAATNQ